ncbi:MAG: hypothetical protein Q9M39_08140 [Sulfurovum sp.]|nr:hypothetical protein [Sulfurovum sp.]
MKNMSKNILLLPWYMIQIFRQAKSFKTNPIIGNQTLNRLGLHAFRVVVSHIIMKFKMFSLAFSIPKGLRKSYYEKGYIILDKVLDKDIFDNIVNETYTENSEIRECIQGNTLTQRIHLSKNNLTDTKGIQNFLAQKNIVALFKFTSGKNHRPLSHIQVIKNNYITGKHDPQKTLHRDTFHPTMKYWFFLQDVGEDIAPFTYVEGSNRLTWKRLKWEYKKKYLYP